MTEEKEILYAHNLVKGERMKGLTIEEAAKELGVSTRTIFRMLKDGRLKAEKWGLPYAKGRFYWIIDPMSVARIQVRKEIGIEKRQRNSKEDK